LTGEGRLKDVFLDPDRTISQILLGRRGGGRGRQNWYTWPVIVPPVYAKQTLIARLQDAWDDAREVVERADRIVFYGYSLPQLDIEAEKLFQRGLAANTDVEWTDVINPSPDAAQRYAGITPT